LIGLTILVTHHNKRKADDIVR